MNIVTKPSKFPGSQEPQALLEAKLAQLTGTFHDRSGLAVENAADTIDAMVMATGRDLVVQQMNLKWTDARRRRLAIGALARGEYGICEDCGEPIPARRLDATPWARMCVTCQESRDLEAHLEDEGLRVAA